MDRISPAAYEAVCDNSKKLVLKARGASMHHFLNLFSSEDFVSNDRIVGHWLHGRVVDQLAWNHLKPADQSNPTCGLL